MASGERANESHDGCSRRGGRHRSDWSYGLLLPGSWRQWNRRRRDTIADTRANGRGDGQQTANRQPIANPQSIADRNRVADRDRVADRKRVARREIFFPGTRPARRRPEWASCLWAATQPSASALGSRSAFRRAGSTTVTRLTFSAYFRTRLPIRPSSHSQRASPTPSRWRCFRPHASLASRSRTIEARRRP